MSQTSVHRAVPVLFASLLTAALAFGLPHPTAAAQGIEFWNKECRKLLKQYDGKSRHKAFAASNMGAGGRQGQACGDPRATTDFQERGVGGCCCSAEPDG